MSIAALALVVLAQSPAIKLASPGLTGVQLSKEVVSFYSDHLAQQLVLNGMTVITASEIGSLVGLERQKQLIGCADTSASCLAELANALGVDGLITGSIGRFDDVFQINLKVVAANDAHQLAVFSGTASREAKVLSVLTEAAEQMAPAILAALNRAPAAAVTKASPGGGLRRWSWIPAAGGAVALGAGAVLMAQVAGTVNSVRGDPVSTLSHAQAVAAIEGASTQQTIGLTLLAVGSAALVGAGAMFLFGAPPEVAISGGITARGDFAVSLGGTLP